MPASLTHAERLARREAARRRVHRRRRVAAAAVLGVVGLGAVVALAGGGDADWARLARGRPAPSAPPPPELPRGGRTLFPRFRVVGFYGAPQSAQLGELGIGSPDEAARKLARQARPYAAGGRPVLPAFELLATVAAGTPGSDGLYRTVQPDAVIARYLRAARRARALLVLDLQPGHEPFLTEVRRLRRWLAEPDVGLALDPEWSLPAGQVPGRVIGSTDAATVNAASSELADIVRRGRLPEKLLLVHQFTDGMIRDRAALREPPGVALTLNVDGFGSQAVKQAKYRDFTRRERRFHAGFKLFYHEDTGLMSPRQALRLRPHPDVVVYE